jgi:hypothetical protein
MEGPPVKSKPIISVMLDSGAYSAWTKGVAINLKKYIKFCQHHADHLWVPVNLDVIPGRLGAGEPGPAEIEQAAATSFANAITMRKAGIDPVVVYHYGERWYWMEKMLGEGFGYVGLGAVANRPNSVRSLWLDEVFSKMCGAKGFPEVKVHGFGITSTDMIQRYPWYSIDSTTCIIMSGMGRIFIPQREGSSYDYSKPPLVVVVSKYETKGERGGDHFDAWGAASKAYVKYFVEKEGFDFEELVTSDLVRARLNSRVFLRIGRAWVPKAFRPARAALFPEVGTREGIKWPVNEHLKMVFSTNPGTSQDFSFTQEKCRYRLISFYSVGRSKDFKLEKYINSGRVSDAPFKRRKQVAK